MSDSYSISRVRYLIVDWDEEEKARFFDKVKANPERTFEDSPCQEWQAFKADGYGRFKFRGKQE